MVRKEIMGSLKFALPFRLLLLTLPATAGASVQVMVGPTPILDGEARSAGDITVVNERLPFTTGATSTIAPRGTPYGTGDRTASANANLSLTTVISAGDLASPF